MFQVSEVPAGGGGFCSACITIVVRVLQQSCDDRLVLRGRTVSYIKTIIVINLHTMYMRHVDVRVLTRDCCTATQTIESY